MKKNIEKLKKDIIDELENSKAKEIISIDISKVSTLADYIIIATGTSKGFFKRARYYYKSRRSFRRRMGSFGCW